MNIQGDLRRWASASFLMPGFGPGPRSRERASAGGMPVVFYPNGRSCWQINSYLIHCQRCSLAISTIRTYASELSLLVRFIFSRRIDLISMDDDNLIDFADWLSGRSASSNRHINRVLSRVIAFFRWAECISLGKLQVGSVGSFSLIGVEGGRLKSRRGMRMATDRHVAMLPNGARRIVRPMPMSVFHRLLEQCPRSARRGFCRARNRMILLILADTGIRREELVWLRVSDVEAAKSNGGRLSVRTSKRKGHPLREVPLPELTLRELEAFISTQRAMLMRRHQKAGRFHRDLGWALCSESGGRLTPASVTQLFSDLRQLSGVSERATAHMLRHRYITLQVIERIKRLRSVGVLGSDAAATVLAQVSSLSGHSSPASMWDYIDWAYQEMAHEAKANDDDQISSLIDEIDLLRSASERDFDGKGLLDRVRAVLTSHLGSPAKLGVLAYQGGG